MIKNGKTWARIEPNVILESKDEGFYISYNPGNYTISAFNSDDGGSETALVIGGSYYILNGDHREKYEKLIDEGFDACKKYFDKKAKLGFKSSWSN